MMPVAIYILKGVVCSGILYLYYLAALRNKLFHQWNRFFLLSGIALSLSLPLITIPVVPPAAGADTVLKLATAVSYPEAVVITSAPQLPNHTYLEPVLSVLYTAISFLFLVISLTALRRICRIIRAGPKVAIGAAYFIDADAKGTPFSFFNYIIWNQHIDLHTEGGQQIWKHELAHVQEGHTLDKMALNIVLILFWINPFFWLIRRELFTIHEFVADRKAAANSSEAALAQMILTTAYPEQTYLFTSHFFQSLIKRRLYMFTKLQNPKYSYAGRVLALPLLLLVGAAFTLKVPAAGKLSRQIKSGATVNSGYKVQNAPLGDTIVQPAKSHSVNDTNRIFVKGITRAEAQKMNGWTVVNDDTVLVRFANLAISSDSIEHIQFIEGNPLLKMYGERAKNGLIAITTKEEAKKLNQQREQSGGPIFTQVEVEPAFTGGSDAWRMFLQQNLNARVPSSNKAPAGVYTVAVQFIVDRYGNVSDIQPQTKHGFGMEEEVVRVMKLSPKWTPATQNGHTVKAYKKQPVTFVVADEKKKDTNVNTSQIGLMNIFYIGIDNPLTIAVAGFKPEDLIVSISSGSVVRKGKGFIVLVSKIGDVIIRVSGLKEGKLKEVGKFNFKAQVLTEERARELGVTITHTS